MSAVKQLELVSVEDYLASELKSPVKHEYLGGYVYAMAGARNVHLQISSNIHGTLHALLKRKRCRTFPADGKIRIHLPSHVRFYYPDASIVCQPNPRDDSFHDEPVVLFEVLSKRTRRIDEGEKKDAYLTIPSLSVYALVEQDAPMVTVYRRNKQGEFVREIYEGLDAVLPLPEVEIDLPLAEIYDRVEFVEEAEEEDD